MTGPTLEFDYVLSPAMKRAALLAGSKRLAKTSSRMASVPKYIIVGLAVGCGFAILTRLILPSYDAMVLVLIFGLGYCCCFLFWRMSFNKQVDRSVLASQPKGEEVISFKAEQEGLTIRTPGSVFQMEWSEVTKIVLTDGLILIWVGTDNLPVPCEALPEDVDAKQVIALLNDWRSTR